MTIKAEWGQRILSQFPLSNHKMSWSQAGTPFYEQSS